MNLITHLFKAFSGIKICYPLFFLVFLINLITLLLVTFFIARRYDPQFKDKATSLYILGSNRMARSVWYAAIMFVEYWKKETPPNTVYYTVFKDFNLWRNANTFEKILTCTHIISGIIFLFSAIIYYIYHLFNTILFN